MRADDAIAFQVGWALRPKPGETVCGDRVVVHEATETEVLVAVVDGLGHGPLAGEAAEAAARFVIENASLALEELFLSCHRAIKRTRGVAMTVVRVDRSARTLVHAGIGNVDLWAISETPASARPDPGVVGGRVRRVHESRFSIAPGDVFAIVSDGISTRLNLGAYARLGAQSTADAILRDHAKDHDDASCAVLAC